MPSRQILVGVDGSDGSLAAVQWAAGVASALDAEVFAVYVAEIAPTAVAAPAGMGDVTPGVDSEWLETMTTTLREQWCAPLAEAGVTWSCDVISGSPSHALIAAADEVHADLIAVGRDGHGRLAERLMGSTPNYLAHHASQPVVVVPPT